MCNLITEHAANLLHIPRHKSNIQLSGIDHHVTKNKGQMFVDIKTLNGRTIAADQPTLILDRLTVDLPRMPLSPEVLKRTQSFILADPTFHIPNRIDVVLGGALFPQLFTTEQFSLGHNMPYAVGTYFGYVIMGTAPCLPSNPAVSNDTPNTTLNVCLHSISDSDLHSSIQRFWSQEEPPVSSIKTHEEILCDKHFVENHTRDDSGRYIVRLPFKDSNTVLGESKTAAKLRLFAMERKFSTNTHFSELYHDFMDEYLSLGHMSECNDIDLCQPHYFLPHHGVLKESSSTTKLRTVFDASCKTSSGLSLNEILLTGPKLQNNICDLLLQFRRHNVVFCCDIKQMYRQILVHPDDRTFQLILWRSHPNQSPSIFQLNTVTYGINSSPYLAIRTLHQLADDHGDEFPHAAHVLRNHTYVDDIISGADTENEALTLQSQLISLLSHGRFELRKWVSNSPKLLSNLPDTHLETPKFLQNAETPQFSVLGLKWSPVTDAFSYDFQTPTSHKPPTKRSVLSTIAQIYDPCGFLVPFIMLAKCFMQLIWTKGLSWDSPLPTDLQMQWCSFTENIKLISNISIPRPLNLCSTCKIELHGFCDASEVGYAAVTYLRCEQTNQSVSTKLLMAKSRVAPLKRVTIPRLELCAAHLLAQLVFHIKSLFPDKITSNNIHLWSDSTVALTWLQTPPYRLKTYVANRVSQTQELVPNESWRHISSGDNPADCASRGLLMSNLTDHKLWWNGPSWLSLPTSDWPTCKFTPVTLDSTQELKPNSLTILTTTSQEEWSILSKFSSWITLTQIMAYVLRFICNCRSSQRQNGYLKTEELNEAQVKIFSLVQQTAFSKELKLLSEQRICPKTIQRLNPFIDSNGLIRVGGRLTNTSLPYDTRHPILLPKRHHVVNILIDHYHLHHLHAGPQLVQALLSQRVWILCARNVIRSRLHKCLACFKLRPKSNTPLMGELPSCRVNPTKPFSSTGIDYGGPYNIKILNLRFIKQVKVYICLFICMVTKAIHIEVVTDLTTPAFIAALMRFTARRGLCRDIYSDCGTTFVGANTELQKIVQSITQCSKSQDQIQRFASNQGIRFHFNPPAAPHQGGLWESGIKGAKHHLHRVMGNNILTLPEFITLTTRIEAMLNSRPLTPLSSDPSDFNALTPGHFLTGAPLVSIPERDLTQVPVNRLKRWQVTHQLFQTIWRRWTSEYLHTQQQRCKWTTSCQNLKIGDLVLMNSPTSPLQWPLARVIEIFPGRDGIVRVAKVKTSTNTFVRPVMKLCPLPNT